MWLGLCRAQNPANLTNCEELVMLIVRMTFSRVMACEGNQARETLRSSMKLHGKSGMVLLNDKDVSPNVSEPDSASLHYNR